MHKRKYKHCKKEDCHRNLHIKDMVQNLYLEYYIKTLLPPPIVIVLFAAGN